MPLTSMITVATEFNRAGKIACSVSTASLYGLRVLMSARTIRNTTQLITNIQMPGSDRLSSDQRHPDSHTETRCATSHVPRPLNKFRVFRCWAHAPQNISSFSISGAGGNQSWWKASTVLLRITCCQTSSPAKR